jgi:SNF2 family DNA or RNA helicase
VGSPNLKPFQAEGIDWLRDHERALLADEAGLGKTVQLLRSATEPVLVVAPAMVLESGTWDDEIAKWASGIDLTQVSYSSIAQRGERGKVPRDSNGFPLTPLKEQYRQRWGTVVLDECHYIKGRKTSWANAVLRLDSPEWRLATGTPIPNWAQEAFMLLRALWPQEAKAGREFGSYWRWTKKWFDVGTNHFGAKEVGDLRADRTWEEFRQFNWGDRILRRLRDDVLKDLPPLTRQQWLVPMSPDQKRVYNELKKDFVTWLESGEQIDVWSEPGMLVKLAQVASGLETLDPKSKPTGKFKVLDSIYRDRPGQWFVVGHFQAVAEAAYRTALAAGRRPVLVHGGVNSSARKDGIRAFQNGDADVMCATTGVISEGVTLHQAGCHQMVRIERSWTPSKNDQVDRRLHRIGQENPVLCIDLVAPHTLDERVLRVLAEKSDQQVRALGPSDLRNLV